MALNFLNDGYFAGKVGIRTQSPTGVLHIKTTDDSTFWLAKIEADGTTQNALLATTDTTSGTGVRFDLGGQTGSFTVLNSGNVGIGTTSPQAKFVVSNNGAAGMEFQPELGTDTNRILNYDRITSTYMNLRLDANAYQFRISGSEKVTITSTGNVGIGNTNPQYPLHFGDISGYYISIGSGNSTPGGNTPWLGVFNNNSITSATYGWGIYDSSADGSFQIWNRAGNTTGYNTFTIKRGGNVGIGTTSPSGKLTVADGETSGVSKTGLEFIPQDAHNRNIIFSYDRVSSVYRDLDIDANDVHFNNGGTEKMRITSAGNVGIGTTTPTAKLHVAGTGLFTGLVSGITPVNAANFVTKAYVDGSGGGTGPFLPLAGGTMTGNIVMSNNIELRWKDNGGTERTVLELDSSNNLYLGKSGGGTVNIVSGTSYTTALSFDSSQAATFTGNVTAARFILPSTGTTTPVNRYLYTDNTNTGTGKLIIQSGAGSAAYGGAINLFSNSHASKPGWVTAGISSGSGGKFTVNSQGLAGGTDVFTVNASGNATFTGTSSALTVIARDNLFVDAGQLYIGADNASTDNTFRQVVNTGAGSFTLQKRISGTFTDILSFNNANNATFAGTIGSGAITSTGIITGTTFEGSATTVNLMSSGSEFAVNLDNSVNIFGTGFTGTPRIVPVTTAEMDLGGSTNKWKDLYISGDANIGDQAFSAATSSGDASSTLTTKGYVDSLITGATIYRGTWDPDVSLNSGYGNPNLNTVTKTSGYYYICSADGAATPNGPTCEPDSWNTGDWVIWNDDVVDCAGTGTGAWQKIDNSSVLSGVGTGQTVALWEGASSVTDSETLGNAPITVSGNNSTFAGTINLLSNKGVVWPGGSIRAEGNTLKLVATTLIDLQQNTQVQGTLTTTGNATFAGDVNITQTTDVGVLNTTNLDNGSAVGLSLTYPTSNVAAGDGLAIAIGITGRGRSYIANSNITTNLDASNLAFYTESGGVIGERMIINQDGNVGIGETSPDRKLVLDGTLGTPALEIKKNTDRIVYLGTGSSASADDNTILHLMDQNVVKINLNTVGDSYLNGGNVGIGVTGPTAKLHVSGNTKLTGGTFEVSTDASVGGAGGFSYSFRDAVGINNPNSVSAPSVSGYVMSVGRSTSGGVGGGIYVEGESRFVRGLAGAVKFNAYGGTSQTGTPTYLLGTDASGNVVKTNSAPSPITSQAASLYDLIPNGAFTTTYAFTSTAGTYAKVMQGDDVITANGTYTVQMFVNDYAVGGTQYSETYSGIMSWGSSTNTNDTGGGSISEIVLHRSGHAANQGMTYLRTRETTSSEGSELRLEIMCNRTYTGASNVVFKFVRLI